MKRINVRPSARGSALLAVLWLTAALSAISLSVALTVRGETERVATTEEDVRADYLAKGAIQRAILYMQWGSIPGANPYYLVGQPRFHFHFPSGEAVVDLMPESSKLSLNYARPGVLRNLMLALGAEPERAEAIAAGIANWRTPSGGDGSSFQRAHTSFHDVEELLNLPGMTPDLFYGTWSLQGDHLAPRVGVKDCVSVFGGVDGFDANFVQPPVLAAVGVAPADIQMLIGRRQQAPIFQRDLPELSQGDGGVGTHVSVGIHTIYTFRATARMRRADGSLSDLNRVVAATVKLLPASMSEDGFHILRWYDRG